jgi:hypothetical protein
MTWAAAIVRNTGNACSDSRSMSLLTLSNTANAVRAVSGSVLAMTGKLHRRTR